MFDIGFSELLVIGVVALVVIGPEKLPRVARTIGHLAGRLAREAGAADGFRTIINTGRVGHQEVYHVHMHVLGGPEPLGPMLQRKK